MKIEKNFFKQVGESKNDQVDLWRYLTLHKFLDLLQSESIAFTRLDSFDDKNEGISQQQVIVKFGEKWEVETLRKKGELDINKRQSLYYVSCWVCQKRESFAMWDLYSKKDGVAIRVKKEQVIGLINSGENDLLFQKHHDLTVNYHGYWGKVSYKDFLSKEGREKFKEEVKILGFHKDLAYNHEHEFRILLKEDHIPDMTEVEKVKLNLKRPKVVKVKINRFKELEIKVIPHPNMEEWQVENIKYMINKFNFSNIELERSKLSQ